MTEPTQTTIYGAQEPLQAPVPHRSPEYVAVPLFTAPDAMRGQLHLPTDTPSEPCPLTGRPIPCGCCDCRADEPAPKPTDTPSEKHAAARCASLR